MLYHDGQNMFYSAISQSLFPSFARVIMKDKIYEYTLRLQSSLDCGFDVVAFRLCGVHASSEQTQNFYNGIFKNLSHKLRYLIFGYHRPSWLSS